MKAQYYLRVEGLAALGVALAAFVALDGPLWLLVALALAPDLSMAGYLAGNRVGALSYNLAHTYTTPVLLAAVGVQFDLRFAALAAAVWAAHIGADRLVGYGLKSEAGFSDTHLSTSR